MPVKVPGAQPRDAVSAVTWSTLPGKPTSFPPSAHTHPWADVTGKPTTYPPASHTHLWADITDKPITFAPAAHTHSGLLQLIGNVTVSETTLLSLALGMKRMAVTLAGVTTADRLTFAPTGLATTGCEAVNVYASAANQVTVSYFTPALGLGAVYSIPLAVYRIVG